MRNLFPNNLIILSCLVSIDGLAVFSSGWICYFIYPMNSQTASYGGAIIVAMIAMLCFGAKFGAYSHEIVISHSKRVHETLSAWLCAWATAIAIAALFKLTQDYSRIWMVSFLLSTTLLLLLWRITYRAVLSCFVKSHIAVTPTAIYGLNETGEAMAERLTADPKSHIQVIGIYDDRERPRRTKTTNFPYGGTSDELVQSIRHNEASLILLAIPWFAERRATDLIAKFSNTPADIRILIAPPVELAANFKPEMISGLAFLSNRTHRIDPWRETVKEIQDRALALLLLAVSAPLMVFIAIAIKIDSRGPVLFCQIRRGYNNQKFKLYKFRTLYSDAADANADQQVFPGDKRVTGVGKFLRRTSMDELPQLFNVMRGDMALVGPRPHALGARAEGSMYEDIVCNYARRHNVKPGLTGLAQVSGLRGSTDTMEKLRGRVEHDLMYISRWSPWLDWKILLKTLPVVVKGDGSH